MTMQATITGVQTGNWCIYTKEPGMIVTEWDAIKQRIAFAVNTISGTNPLRPFHFSEINNWIAKPANRAIPNIKKEIIDAIAIAVPEVKVSKVLTAADVTGNIVYQLYISDGENSDVIVIDVLSGIAEITGKGTIILEADAPLNPEGFLAARLTLANGVVLNSAAFTTLKDLRDAITTSWSAYGTYGNTARKIIAYIKPEYPLTDLQILDIVSLTISNVSTYPTGTIYVLGITLGGITDTTERTFANITALLTFLNGTFKSTNSLIGTFYLIGDLIQYANYEGFTSGNIDVDTHIHSTVYDLVYN